MALLHMDGFDYWPTDVDKDDFAARYEYLSGSSVYYDVTATYTPYDEGQSLYLRSNNYLGKAIGSNENVIYTGFAFRVENQSDDDAIINFIDIDEGANSLQCGLYLNETGYLVVYNGASTPLAYSTEPDDGGDAANILSRYQWHYIEIYVKIGESTSGEFTLIVDGSTWIDRRSGASTNGLIDTRTTANDYTNLISLRGTSSDGAWFDDWWIDNATNHGNCRILTISPTGDGTTSNWTGNPDNTNKYANINETGETITNTDADYVTSSTTAQKQQFTMASDAIDTGYTVKGINTLVRFEKSDAGAQNLKVRTGSETAVSHAASESIIYSSDIFESYTPATVNGIQIELEYE